MVDRVERGSRYEHDEYGTVEVIDFERQITAIDGMQIAETFYVRFVREGERETRLTERVDAFRETATEVES